jgi:Leucine-rich repeat (LRR) protein
MMKVNKIPDIEFYMSDFLKETDSKQIDVFDKKVYENIQFLMFSSPNIEIEWIGEVEFPNLEGVMFAGVESKKTIESFGKYARNLNNLKSLYFERINITKIPEFIHANPSLEDLTFRSEQNFKEIPKEILKLENLKSLSFQYCRNIKAIPDDIKKLKNLESFSLWEAKLDYFSPELFNLPKLKHINLAYTQYKPLEEFLRKRGDYKPDSLSIFLKLKDYKKEIIEISKNIDYGRKN